MHGQWQLKIDALACAIAVLPVLDYKWPVSVRESTGAGANALVLPALSLAKRVAFWFVLPHRDRDANAATTGSVDPIVALGALIVLASDFGSY
ncbi:MAG: hypothetical protein ACK54C_10975 [Betaproteobacteria bacterium]|jgi:hypothetical protein